MSKSEKGSPRRRGPHTEGQHGGGHHGGAWKVAYADFTTAMMAFFMLLWILAASSPQQKHAIAQYFRNEGPFQDGGSSMTGDFDGGPAFLEMSPASSVMAETNTLEQVAQQLGEALQATAGKGAGEGVGEGAGAGLKDQVKISVTNEGLVIEIADDPEDELFAVGKADMNAAFGQTLDDVAAHLKTLPNAVRLEGYTDARQYPAGAPYTNWELSVDRANAARRRLETHGLARARFQSVVGYGDGRLAVPDAPLAPGNRRITITVLRENPMPPAIAGPIEAPVQGFRPLGRPYVPPQTEAKAAKPAPAPASTPAPAPANTGHGH
jgi:chemotaxis protein MotB